MATLRSISDEIDLKSKTASRDKVGYYTMTKWSISRKYNNYKDIRTQHQNT